MRYSHKITAIVHTFEAINLNSLGKSLVLPRTIVAIFLDKVMKKIIILSSVLVLAGLAMSSCKSHERCPAYGQVETTYNQPSDNA